MQQYSQCDNSLAFINVMCTFILYDSKVTHQHCVQFPAMCVYQCVSERMFVERWIALFMSDCDRFLIRPSSLFPVRDHVQHSSQYWTGRRYERVFCETTTYQNDCWYHTRVHVFVRLHRLLELSGALNHACNGQHYRQRQQANDKCPSLRANPDLLFCCGAQKSLVL